MELSTDDAAGDEKTADAIIDLMNMELGESSGKQDVSARSKFNAFLLKIEYGRDYDNLRKKDMTMELVGKFCSFLLQDTVSWQTSMDYLSSIKRQLETTVRTDLFKKGSEWYKRCRRNLHQQFVLRAIKTGKRLKDQTAMVTLEDLEEMSKVLFLQNKSTALMDRTLLNNQWLSIGRSSDIGNLLFDDLHWLDRFLVIDATRLKVRQQHSLSIFCSPGKWTIDPFHSLACQLVADPYNASNRVFSQIIDGKNESRIAAHINRLLKTLDQSDIRAVLTPGLQSHSARRGGAAHASSHSDVKLSDLAHRGLWSMDGFATLMEYISPTTASDQTIAKVLGGWTDPDRAGLPPTLSCFQRQRHEAHARVTEFATIMRRLYFAKISKQSFADCLAATLLMYYDGTYGLMPDHIVHKNIAVCAREMSLRTVTVSELKIWGRFIRKHFVLDNLLSLPVQFVKENMSERELSEQYVGIHTFAEALEKGVAGYREVVAELQDLKNMMHTVLDSLHGIHLSAAGRCACRSPTDESRQSPMSLSLGSTPNNPVIAHLHAPATPATPAPDSLLGRSWPHDFTSVKDLLLQDLIVRYVLEGLAFAVYIPGNRVQKEVQSAIQIVREFVEMASLPSGQQHRTEALVLTHRHALTEFACRVQKAIINFIEQNKLRAQVSTAQTNPTTGHPKKRSRPLSGMVTGIVRAWGQLDPKIRASAARAGKLRFQPPT